jgi:hypothetical protein
MQIITPTQIESVAWEGELVPPATTKAVGPADRPVVTIGRPEIWPVAEALENEVGRPWSPPQGDAGYWLVRLACTLRHPPGLPRLTEATQTLDLRPKNFQAAKDSAYAFSLFPDRLGAEDKAEFNASLGPELKFASGAGFSLGQLGAKIEYRKVFPVIQSYGAGESTPYWRFQPHRTHPLDGSQFVYAVVVAQAGAGGIRAFVELVVTVDFPFGLAKFGLSDEARANTHFVIS